MITRIRIATLVALFGAAAAAAPPGPLDGLNIPSNFGAGALLGTQSNRTGFGNQGQIVGGVTPGSETDRLYVRNDDTNLYVGITGNVRLGGDAFMIFIDSDNSAATGQNELKTQGVDGPPHTLQSMGQPTTDCLTFGTGTKLPTGFGADYAITVDISPPGEPIGTMYVSEYTLSAASVGMYACDMTNMAPLYASRAYAGSSPASDNNGVMEGSTGLGYAGGFNNTNTAGVTATSGAGAASATTGLELSIPLARIGSPTPGPTTMIKIMVVLASGGASGPTGTAHNQLLPPTASANCSPPAAFGVQADLSGQSFITHALTAGNAAPTDPLDGQDIAGTFTPGALKATQSCPTSAGDQFPDPTQVTYTGGSELDALYASNDFGYIYLGITGNIETNGNAVIIYIDSKAGGERLLSGNSGAGAVSGMNGDALPLAPDGSDVLYDYAMVINAGGGGSSATHPYYIDFVDLQAGTGYYAGSGTTGTGSGVLSGGSNPNCIQVAYNRTNVDGVVGCGDADPCFSDSIATVMMAAATATKGFEIGVPLAAIGVGAFPTTVRVWVYIASGGGYGSDQSLPPLRTALSPAMKINAGDGPTDFTVPGFPTASQAYDGRAASYTATGVAMSVTITAASPPNGHYDTLQNTTTALVAQGVGASGTPDEGTVTDYPAPKVTFSATPAAPPTPCNIVVSCTGGTCPAVTAVSGSDAGPYTLTLSGPIPAGACLTATFAGTVAGQKLQYRFGPADVNINGTITGQDVLSLVTAINMSATVLARHDINRNGVVTGQDVLRAVQLLNGGAGVSPPAGFNGAMVAACP